MEEEVEGEIQIIKHPFGEYTWGGKKIKVCRKFVYYENRRYEITDIFGPFVDIKSFIDEKQYILFFDNDDKVLHVIPCGDVRYADIVDRKERMQVELVSDIVFVYSPKKIDLCGSVDGFINVDMNQGAGGSCIFPIVKKSMNIDEAVTDFKLTYGKDPPPTGNYWKKVDLNMNHGVTLCRKNIYLWIERDPTKKDKVSKVDFLCEKELKGTNRTFEKNGQKFHVMDDHFNMFCVKGRYVYLLYQKMETSV